MTIIANTEALHVGQNVTVRFHGKKAFPGTVEVVTAKTVVVEFTRDTSTIDRCRFVSRGTAWHGGGAILTR